MKNPRNMVDFFYLISERLSLAEHLHEHERTKHSLDGEIRVAAEIERQQVL